MKSVIKFYVIGASENIRKRILMNFFEELCFEKGKILMFFWKGNKTKDGIKAAL